MISAQLPANEDARIAALYRYGVLDTAPEQSYDDAVAVASLICGAPISFISLVDHSRQWFKAKIGIDISELHRDIAFCAHVVQTGEMLIVNDTLKDKRFDDHPFVTAGLQVRFYAGAPLTTPDGFTLGTICVIDQKPREMTRAQLESLQALSRQIVSQLELRRKIIDLRAAQVDLQIAKDEADRASIAKSQFLSNISYEMRTPLNGIFGMTEMLFDSPLSDIQKEQLELLQTCGDELHRLIDNALSFRPDSDRSPISEAVFDLRSTVQETIGKFSTLADEKSLSLTCEIIADGVTLRPIGDETRVRQILTNLLSNAVKFTQHGQIRILLKAERKDESFAEFHFVVEDSGVGIAEENLSRIFQNFTQLDSSTTRIQAGAGLGLTTSRVLAERMNGQLWAVSQPARGSAFHFSFHARTEAAA